MSDFGPRILIVDDDHGVRRLLTTVLEANGCKAFAAACGEDGLHLVTQDRPDLVLLDLGLPDIDGMRVLERLRAWSSIPIIIVSVRDTEADKAMALDAGADDYLTKPFSTAELMARIRANLRRLVPAASNGVVQAADLTMDLTRHQVTSGDREITLTPTEYDLLRVLVTHPGRVLTHQQLLRQVWGNDQTQDVHLLRVNVSNLRRKLETDPADPRYIITEAGVGYRFRDLHLHRRTA